jgi:hypothetical protein
MYLKRFAKRGNKQDTDWALKQLPKPPKANPAVVSKASHRLADKPTELLALRGPKGLGLWLGPKHAGDGQPMFTGVVVL